MIRFYLDFISSGHGKRYIDEPQGFDGIDFMMQKEDDRIAMDSFLAAGTNKIRFNNRVNHCFDIIMYNYDMFGYESIVKFGIEFDDDNKIIGEIDFATRDTDKVTYIEVTIRDENYKQRLKRNEKINTNLLGNTDVNGNPIEPCQTVNVLLKAKPIVQISKFEIAEEVTLNIDTVFPSMDFYGFNYAQVNTKYDIEDTLNFLQPVIQTDISYSGFENFNIIRAKENLSNIEIEIETEMDYSVTQGTFEGQGFLALYLIWGDVYDPDISNPQRVILYNDTWSMGTVKDVSINQIFRYTIPLLSRTHKIWLHWVGWGNADCDIIVTTKKFSPVLTAISTAYNTVVPMIRLYDAMKYTVKSASQMNIEAPRWNESGEFYEQFITSTPLLRRLLDKPFNVTFKDITDDYFPEVYGDFQIQEDGTIFIGRYPDFYRDIELYRYTQEQFLGYVNTSNPKYTINQLYFKYSNYASQKEANEENTYDIVHGESQNKLAGIDCVQNEKSIDVGWVRDAFLIELSRRKGYDLSDTSATQDDNKVYLIDVIDLPNDERQFTETSVLQHTASGGVLTLTNDGTFSWELLGIVPGTPFSIDTGANMGLYTVSEVGQSQIFLFKLIPPPPVDIAEEATTYTYVISALAANYMNRTTEGFSEILNIQSGDRFANLRFTVTRNIINYYIQYLATANMYADNTPTNNSLYINNGLASTRLVGETESIIENQPIEPHSPILTPETDKIALKMSLREFLTLMSDMRSKNGYITYTDSNGYTTKGYIYKCSFQVQNVDETDLSDFIGTLSAEVEIKHELFLLNIFSDGQGIFVINDSIPVVGFNFEINELNKVTIFDGTGKMIHPPVMYNRIKVNNSEQASSPIELAQWLNAIM
jgi:hypothetical protein